MEADEAISLIKRLGNKSEGALFAKKQNWKYSMSQEARILADLHDLLHKANSSKKNIKLYPRPFNPAGRTMISGTPIKASEAIEKYAAIQARLQEVKPI